MDTSDLLRTPTRTIFTNKKVRNSLSREVPKDMKTPEFRGKPKLPFRYETSLFNKGMIEEAVEIEEYNIFERIVDRPVGCSHKKAAHYTPKSTSISVKYQRPQLRPKPYNKLIN